MHPFVTEKSRADLVALMVLGTLVVAGLFQRLVSCIRPWKWITSHEGIAGSSNPAPTSFATPVGYQTNAMVYQPGGYRYMDFMRVGIPLNLIFWVLAVYYIPKFWLF